MVYRNLLAGLLFLISLSFIFTTPGINQFNIVAKLDELKWTERIAFSPGQYLNKLFILNNFPIPEGTQLEYHTDAWLAVKFELYTFYLITMLIFFYLARKISNNKFSLIHTATLFLLNVPLLLLSVALGFNNILAAPFLLMALFYYFSGNRAISLIAYLLAILFDTSLLILAPVIVIKELRDQGVELNRKKLLLIVSISTIPIIYLADKFSTLLSTNHQLLIPNIPWLLFQPIRIFNNSSSQISIVFITLFLLAALIGIIFLLRSLIGIKGLVVTFLILISAFTLDKFFIKALIVLITGGSLLLYFQIIAKPFTRVSLILSLFLQYLIYVILFPGATLGNLLWLSIFGLTLYLANPSELHKRILFSQALISFMTIYCIIGTAGITPVNGIYFQVMTYLYAIFFNLSSIWLLLTSISTLAKPAKELAIKVSQMKLAWWIIIFMVLVNVSLITANGSSDSVAWAEYSRASIIHPNPFSAQAVPEIDQRYPPLNTLIMGGFANAWHYLVGPDPTYAIATKLSIFVFYFLTLLALFKFTPNILTKTQKWLIGLTTFSLVIQTQGFADVNIYLVPSMLMGIFMLFRKQYFWSGLFMGITMSIKWQPVIILPLFFLTIITLKESLPKRLKRLAVFTLPFLFLPVFTWWLVIINPGGWDAFDRATEYLIHGAPALSGQALNLNWIVTYYLHYAYPIEFSSLQHLDYVNERVATYNSPAIWHGYLFLIVASFIFIKYWLLPKKDLVHFSATALMIFFSHHQLNKSAYEKHLFYTVLFMLFLYLLKPTSGNRKLLILFDIMVIMNLIFFYGFTGPKDVSRMFFSIDLTVIFSFYYLIIFCWVLWRYFKKGDTLLEDDKKDF